MSVPTPEQIQKFTRAFNEYDDDRDGYIETSMVERAIRSMGLNPTRQEMNDIMSDISSSNKLSLNGFVYICHHIGCFANTEKQLIKAFQLFDRDGTGMIKKDVARDVLTKLDRPLNDAQLEKLFSALKVDNGFVDIKELAKTLLSQ
ncbi:EF hand family protein [Trichomonas vaginalis G3]|uniref:EF hand family protein n=1 Tax=Trichomonas vaginalis (strain ATCC PRA-98 / G3) TaxID=412133 RepID=A2EJ25_TRIV3|nr:calcium-binding protein family [Trichomonas vaginalis G3]EAY07328.1 EF hand family protein [Trichomonas vaginalis G3]KAI5524501.1 calcium-binding protein family [Trichomonas vaginalis G3]|eukprot:XP_001319551.1 EF hand family protein [Trichomonas vaginalis G3]